jgi:hypothetical protein
MKIQKLTMIERITKTKQPMLFLKMGKLSLFLLLLLASKMNAQQPKVKAFPALDIGQRMLITQSSPLWTDAMSASSITRSRVQSYLNACPSNCQPTNAMSCVGQVCCKTEPVKLNGDWVYLTVCWNNTNGNFICSKITQ